MAASVLLRAVGREDKDRVSQQTKIHTIEKGIDWLEEGKQIGRPFAVEAIKAMFRGTSLLLRRGFRHSAFSETQGSCGLEAQPWRLGSFAANIRCE